MTPQQHVAPLVHAKLQFNQDCVCVINGAAFRIDSAFLALVRDHLRLGVDLVVNDLGGEPHVLKLEDLEIFLNKGNTVLVTAVSKFMLAKAAADAQFNELHKVVDESDEETDV